MSECVDALAACILACTSNTPLSPDGGPAVALLENDTLHNNFKQTWVAQLSADLGVREATMNTKSHFRVNVSVFAEKRAVICTYLILTDVGVVDSIHEWPW